MIVLTAENCWEEVTVKSKADRNGPVLKRIGVPGGYLYTAGDAVQASHLVFVEADRTDWSKVPKS